MENKNVTIGDLLTIDGKKYITMQILEYNGNVYAFVNQMTINEEPTNEYYIFKIFDDGIKIVVDESLKNILMPEFEKLLKKDIENIISE